MDDSGPVAMARQIPDAEYRKQADAAYLKKFGTAHVMVSAGLEPTEGTNFVMDRV